MGGRQKRLVICSTSQRGLESYAKSDWKSRRSVVHRAREIVKLAKQGFVENELFISEEMFDRYSTKYGIPAEGDIMVTGVGTLGICYVVKKDDRFYFKDGNIIWLKKKTDAESRFVEYAFQSDDLRNQIDDSVGATVGTYTIIKAKGTRIPVPALSEQQRIVGILDEAFDGIATAKANAEKNLQNARALFASHLNAVFTQRGPGWVERKLEDVVDATCTLSYGIVQPGDEYPNGLPVVRPTDLTAKMIQLDGLKRIDPRLAESYRRTQLCGDDFLLCVRGSTGMVSIAALELAGANVTRGIVPIRFNKSAVTREFGYYVLIAGEIQGQIREKTYGAALMQINIRDLRNITFSLPPLKEQKGIAAKLDALTDGTQRLESICQQKLAALEELKKSLLDRAFKGQLTMDNG